MIRNKLSIILGEKRISQRELERRTGIRRQTISDIYNEINITININHLDKLCQVLDCDICDLFEYIPDKKSSKKSFKKIGKK